MSTRQIHVFISHSWKYSSHYGTLENWIFYKTWRVGQARLDLRNFSVPRSDPIVNANNDLHLKRAIHKQIARSHVVIIPTGMYAHHSKWINKEIEGAILYGKPILAVEIRGSQRSPSVVVSAASQTVGWNSKSVVHGIWQLYR